MRQTPSKRRLREVAIAEMTPLLESNGLQQAGRGRVYRDVTIIKSGLGNRRDRNYYSPAAIREAVEAGMFDKLRAFADHPTSVDEEIQPERTIRDLVGIYTNPRFVESADGGGSAKADLRILKSQRWLSETVDELIEHGLADKLGISINGHGKTVPKSIREAGSDETIEVNEVTQFLKLKSADVVTEAGAGGGWQQLMEAARGAATEHPMAKRDTLLKKLRESVAKGDIASAKKANEELATLDAAEAKAPKRRLQARPTAEQIAAHQAAADEADDLGEDDEDDLDDEDDEDELEASVDDAKSGALHEAGIDPDDESGEIEAADGEDDEDEEDETEDDEEDTPPAKATKECDTREDRLRKAIAKQRSGAKTLHTPAAGDRARAATAPTPVQEARRKKMGRRQMNVLGVPTAGAGSFVKRSREAADRRLTQENRVLREALGKYRKIDAARKLLKESALPEDLHGPMIPRLVRCANIGEMQEDIRFQERFIEGVGSRVVEDVFDDIDGAGSSRLREGYGHVNGDADFDGDVDGLLRESGLPLRDDA